jgi:hypothetical protein
MNMSILKSLAIAAMSIAMLMPAKAENEVGDSTWFHRALPGLEGVPQNTMIGCTRVEDTSWTHNYTTEHSAGIGFTYADFRLLQQIRENAIAWVNDLHEGGRYCVLFDPNDKEFLIVAKKYTSNGGLTPSDTPPTAFYDRREYLCIQRKDSVAFPNNACVWVLVSVKKSSR